MLTQRTINFEAEDIIEARKKDINLSQLCRNSLKAHLQTGQLEGKLKENDIIHKLNVEKAELMNKIENLIKERNKLLSEVKKLKERKYGRVLKEITFT